MGARGACSCGRRLRRVARAGACKQAFIQLPAVMIVRGWTRPNVDFCIDEFQKFQNVEEAEQNREFVDSREKKSKGLTHQHLAYLKKSGPLLLFTGADIRSGAGLQTRARSVSWMPLPPQYKPSEIFILSLISSGIL